MLYHISDIETIFTIEQTLVLGGNVVAQANTKYTSNGAHIVSLPPPEGIGAVELGSAVIIDQVAGIGTVRDNVSVYGLVDQIGDNLEEVTVEPGTKFGVMLVIAYGRKQWMMLPQYLVDNA
jgi:hypothetical protein